MGSLTSRPNDHLGLFDRFKKRVLDPEVEKRQREFRRLKSPFVVWNQPGPDLRKWMWGTPITSLEIQFEKLPLRIVPYRDEQAYGIMLSASNCCSERINSYSVEVTELCNWNSDHRTFVPILDFQRMPVANGTQIDPGITKDDWFVKAVLPDAGDHLLLGCANRPLIWPTDNPTSFELWRVILTATYDPLPDLTQPEFKWPPYWYQYFMWDRQNGVVSIEVPYTD
jgi:hypothetical protein